MTTEALPVTDDPAQWIFDLPVPDWDQWFMAMTFLVAMRSPDQQTKQGCVLVDWPTRTIMSVGYNGHPRGSRPYFSWDSWASGAMPITKPLPTVRAGTKLPDGSVQDTPDKYSCMIHADINALLNASGHSDYAVCYLPMPPCENCLMFMLNHPRIHVRRIVYLEERDFPLNKWVMQHMPSDRLVMEKYWRADPVEVLENAAQYLRLRQNHSGELSKRSTKSYTAKSHSATGGLLCDN